MDFAFNPLQNIYDSFERVVKLGFCVLWWGVFGVFLRHLEKISIS